jgi:glycerate kinase
VRVLIAPDGFAGTLTAQAAAEAIAAGWRAGAPGDELDLAPQSDGGPGLLSILDAAFATRRRPVPVTDPLGRPVTAEILTADGACYVESAQACGLHLVEQDRRDPRSADTAGLAPLLTAAAGEAPLVVVGLGGSATCDGGAGMLRGLGLRLLDAAGAPLPAGGAALTELARIDVPPGWAPPRCRLDAAVDVHNPLLGPQGAAPVFGPQKGADPAAVARLTAGLTRFAEVATRDLPGAAGREHQPGAAAAGGLGYGLLLLGARVVSGAELVLAATRCAERAARADLVVTGEGCLDEQSLFGKVVTRVAGVALAAGVPCLVLAGEVRLGRRQAAAAGIEASYGVAEHAGGRPASLADPAGTLAALASTVAGDWSPNARRGGAHVRR